MESIPGLLKRLQIWALVAKGHKNTNAPLIFENLGHYFFLVLGKLHNGPFLGIFRGGLDFFDPKKSLGPLEISLKMAHYVVCPQKKNNIQHFQNQQCINSYKNSGTGERDGEGE